MTYVADTKSKRRLWAKLGVALAISAMLALGAFTTSANAEEYHRDRDSGHNWNGGYYRAPPVIYGSPYGSSYYGSPYYAPPVVYGPGIGLDIIVRQASHKSAMGNGRRAAGHLPSTRQQGSILGFAVIEPQGRRPSGAAPVLPPRARQSWCA